MYVVHERGEKEPNKYWKFLPLRGVMNRAIAGDLNQPLV